MSIRDIRDYIDTQIKKVDANILEYKRDLFGNNDVTKNQAQKFYNLVIGPTTLVRSGSGFTDNFPITLSIWESSKRNISGSFDTLYDKAIDIRNNIICPLDIATSSVGFSDIEALDIEPSEESTNDNTIKMELSFIARVDFKF